MLIKGHKDNAKDFLLNRIQDKKARENFARRFQSSPRLQDRRTRRQF